jgi:hypothetical protein
MEHRKGHYAYAKSELYHTWPLGKKQAKAFCMALASVA